MRYDIGFLEMRRAVTTRDSTHLYVIAALGMAVSAGAFGLIRHLEFLRTEAQFHQLADQRLEAVRAEIAGALDIVSLLDGNFEAFHPRTISRKEFSVLAAHELANHPYIQALEWIPRVDHPKRREYERLAQADGFPTFGFTESGAHGRMQAEGRREEYFPVFYVEPLAGNVQALGYDLASNPVRLAALTEAMDKDRVVATARITLVQEKGDQYGILAFSPVYHGSPKTVAERRSALKGFALGVLRISDLISRVDSQAELREPSKLVNIHVFDISAPKAQRQLYPKTSVATLEELRGEFHVEHKIPVGGRTWLLLASPAAGASPPSSNIGSRVVLLSGLLLTSLCILYFAAKTRQSEEMARYTLALETSKKKLEERTRELAEQGRLATLTANIGVALTQSGQLRDTLQQCAELIVRYLDAAFVRIWVLSESDNVLELEASAGMYTHLDGVHARIPVGSFKIGQIAQRRMPLLTNSVIGDAYFTDQDWARREGMAAFAGYPLIVGDRLMGVVALFARKALADKIVRSLGAVADEIALGIDRKRNEQALASSEKRFRIAAENGSDVILEQDLRTGVNHVLGRTERMLDSPEEFPLSFRDFQRMLHADDRDRVVAAIRHHLETNEPYREEFRVLDKKGAIRYWSARGTALRDPAGAPHKLIVVTSDITGRKQAEAALSRLAAIVESSATAIISLQLDGTILTWNAGAERIYGYVAAEVCGRNVSLFYPPGREQEIPEVLGRVAEGKTVDHLETLRIRKDGTLINLLLTVSPFRDASGKIIGATSVGWDITERKLLERQLLQAQKLESIGQLAAGIAHEINTPIQYVGDNIRFLREGFDARSALFTAYERLRRAAEAAQPMAEPLAALAQAIEDADLDYLNEEIPKAMEQSLDGVERVATIVRAMKEFAHPGRTEKGAADLNQALSNTLIVARNELKYVADVETDFGELPPVVCHLAEMNQVFLNILVNSAQAIAEVMKTTEKKGRIVVRTRHAGNSVVIEIGDTGSGIPADIEAKVFDPFFTTKPVGQGTGQGLAIARSIVVEKHGGSLTFEPNAPHGTTFLISLPIDVA